MARKHYPDDYKQRLVELVRSGRSAEQLSQQFEPAAKTIRDWVKAADAAQRGPIGDKDAEIARLREEVAILREEREILKKAAAWFATEGGLSPKKRSGS